MKDMSFGTPEYWNMANHPFNGKEKRRPCDRGSYSRYFSLDAWADKNLPELPENIQATYPFMIVPKAAKSEKNKGLDNFPDIDESKNSAYDVEGSVRKAKYDQAIKKNTHATVKPLKLMSYLITLGSRPNDIILDPFMGSGTTGIAAKLLNRNFNGMEMNSEYMTIAKERIKNFTNEKTK